MLFEWLIGLPMLVVGLLMLAIQLAASASWKPHDEKRTVRLSQVGFALAAIGAWIML